jgi:hypothetical protein
MAANLFYYLLICLLMEKGSLEMPLLGETLNKDVSLVR